MRVNCAAARSALASLAACTALAAHGQGLPDPSGLQRAPQSRPGELPQARPLEPQIIIPEAVPQPPPALGAPRVLVREIRVTGNTVLDPAEIAAMVRRYVAREASSEDLLELAHQLSRLYAARGYINSGFVLPDQDVTSGVIEYRAIEGRLASVEIPARDHHLRESYVEDRVRRAAQGVLRLETLRDSLAQLRQGGLIETISAELAPGAQPGEAVLRLAYSEARPWRVFASYGNNRSPSVGALRTELGAAHRNLSGNADALELRLGRTRGIEDHAISYALPLNAADTTLTLRHSKTLSEVVERPFDVLRIRAETRAGSVGIAHPVALDPTRRITLGLTYETKDTQTTLLGVPFSFSAGIPDGRSKLDIVRGSLDYQQQSSREVLAARMSFNAGGSNAASPKDGGAGPDRGFYYTLFQSQWARRISSDGDEFIARFDWQDARRILQPSERFGLGGAGTVRGLRENQLLRDSGHFWSLEYRHSLTESDSALGQVQVAPFLDHGRSRNRDRSSAFPPGIAAAGLAFYFRPNPYVNAQLHLAKASRSIPSTTRDLQDKGVHFQISVAY